jgi:hypothetical protein
LLPSVVRRTFWVPGAFEVFVIANEATSASGPKFLLVSFFYDRASLTPLRGWSEIEVQAAEVMGLVIEFGELNDGATQTDQALAIIRTLLRQGLMTAGDVSDEGFREWGIGPEESMSRIEHEWRALGRLPSLDEVCWLSNTERGDSVAREGVFSLE